MTHAPRSHKASTPNPTDPKKPVRRKTPREIERKFIVTKLPKHVRSSPKRKILQGYLAVSEEGTEVRLRRKGDKYFQAIKSHGDLSRSEIEVEISKKQFEEMWPATKGRRVRKLRYEVDHKGVRIELEVYRGALKGLIIAEVEFPTVKKSEAFTPPSWFGREVTHDARFKNKNLALLGLPTRKRTPESKAPGRGATHPARPSARTSGPTR